MSRITLNLVTGLAGAGFGIAAILLGASILDPGNLDDYRAIALIIYGLIYLFLEVLVRKKIFWRTKGRETIFVLLFLVSMYSILAISIWPFFGDPEITFINLFITTFIVLRASIGSLNAINGSS